MGDFHKHVFISTFSSTRVVEFQLDVLFFRHAGSF
jgi:hypothetical protein